VARNSSPFVPVGPGVAVGEHAADAIVDAEIAQRPRPIPAGIIFVAGLVIALGRVILGHGSPAAAAAVDEIVAAFGIEHRHAELGEAEMVGTIVEALLGRGFPLHRE
jgi:hypothetical protein